MVAGRLAEGAILGLCTTPPPKFPAGLDTGAACLGAGAGLAAGAGAGLAAGAGADLLSKAAHCRLATAMTEAKISAVETHFVVLRTLDLLIEFSFPSGPCVILPVPHARTPVQRY
jgi:hypothetical protein